MIRLTVSRRDGSPIDYSFTVAGDPASALVDPFQAWAVHSATSMPLGALLQIIDRWEYFPGKLIERWVLEMSEGEVTFSSAGGETTCCARIT